MWRRGMQTWTGEDPIPAVIPNTEHEVLVRISSGVEITESPERGKTSSATLKRVGHFSALRFSAAAIQRSGSSSNAPRHPEQQT